MKSKLNKNARAWVRALRSGKYKQGKNQLRSGDRFCCLGVACELAVKAGVIGPPVLDKTYRYGDSRFELDQRVGNWLGLRDNAGRFMKKGEPESLSDLNDHGKKFVTIARIIESKPEGLFVD
jgi:hypothetical protein